MFKILGGFLQRIIDIAGDALNLLLALFPPSPFDIVQDSQFNDLVEKINYFIPVYEFVSIMESWLIAIAIYYLYSIYARWVKAIQ